MMFRRYEEGGIKIELGSCTRIGQGYNTREVHQSSISKKFMQLLICARSLFLRCADSDVNVRGNYPIALL